MQFCLICELLAYFLIHAANALKTTLKLLYCIPDDFKELFPINFTGSLNVKHCHEFFVFPFVK